MLANRKLPAWPNNLLDTAAKDKTGTPTAEAVPAVLAYTGSGRRRLANRQRLAKRNHWRSTVAEEELTVTPTVPAVLGNPQPETTHDPNTEYND